MKLFRVLLLFSLFLFFFGTNVQAQRKNIIKASPLGAPLGGVSGGFERAITPKLSAVIVARYLNLTIGEIADGEWSWESKGLVPEIRFYPGSNKPAPAGFFMGTYGVFNEAKLKYVVYDNEDIGSGSAKFTNIGIGGMIGQQWVINWFTIELFGGLHYNIVNVDNVNVTYTDSDKPDENIDIPFATWGGIYPRVGFTLGVAF